MKDVTIYTDGGCRGNGVDNNVGGYGIILIYKNMCKEVKYSCFNTTNNEMELKSVVDALSMLKEPCNVNLYSDSAYVINSINEKWIYGWIKNGWKNSKKQAVKNKELWEKLLRLLSIHAVTFNKVKGHSDNEYNNRCDELANMAMDEIIGF
ncbi:ribonuclease HI [Clostridium sp. YIM B02555]|uniref:ribonuclease HI n=1 Tax=Clostridium sp. YIM B02555 TaxID=2911968 RepID=UPI001EEDE0FE|nr:ribonuclease HI [Clostridium sp. YIM B02555]